MKEKAFDQETLVFKVGGKMYALVNINGNPFKVNLKCDPLLSQDLRTQYEEIEPGYHMNKRHWNTVRVDAKLEDDLIKQMIEMSYQLVVKLLPKTLRGSLGLE